MNDKKSIQELTKNYSPRIGKTWRLNRYYFSTGGKRVGNRVIYSSFYYSRWLDKLIAWSDVQCKYVTDQECFGWHYYAGEYPTRGWMECTHPRGNHVNKRISSGVRRSREKRELKKIVNDINVYD